MHFYVYESCCLDLSHTRYCAIAPTILAGQIDPLLFEALYVSSSFCILLNS